MKRFLIIDDDTACRTLIAEQLKPLGHCDTAAGGQMGIAAVQRALNLGRPYDIVCLDIMMPEMDGHETLRTIRLMESDHGVCGGDGVKVIMTTALRNSKHCIQAFEEGCESYVTKPIRQKELLREVRRLLPDLSSLVDECLASEHSQHEQAAERQQASNNIRCLVVDDDGVCRELIHDFLEDHANCDFAYDGAEAIDAVRLAIEDEMPYDLVCLDIMMPGTTGHQALEGIREIEQKRGIYGSSGVKVIMTTALRDSKHCVQAFREGCESYVTKPVKKEELLKRMMELGLIGQDQDACRGV